MLKDPETTASPTLPKKSLLRRLHSLTGTIPVGGFLLLHLGVNLQALRGEQHFDATVALLHRLPLFLGLEIVGIYAPLLFHAVYGVRLSFTALPKLSPYPDAKGWADILQRVTGLIALIFIAAHFWQFRMQVFLGRMDRMDYFPELCASLSSTNGLGIPMVALGYLLGIAACAYHFASGLVSFSASWGIGASDRGRRWTIFLSSLLGVLLFVVGAMITLYFATGSALLVGTVPGRAVASAVGSGTEASGYRVLQVKRVFKASGRV